MSELIKLMGLWESKDKNGNAFYSGKLGNARVIIMKNGYKEQDNHPDYEVLIKKNEPKQKEQEG